METLPSASPAHRPLTGRVHIADITSTSIEYDQHLDVTVVLVWPYSSATKEFSLLLFERDVALRKVAGQIKVTFHDACAREVAKSRLGIGDDLRIKLHGASLVEEEDQVATPGKKARFTLHYKSTVYLEAVQPDGQIQSISYTAPPPPSPLTQNVTNGHTQVFETPVREKVLDVAHTRLSASVTPLKTGSRLSSNSYPGSFVNPFVEEDGSVLGRGRKRTKFARRSGAWRLATDGDEEEGVLIQDTSPPPVQQPTPRETASPIQNGVAEKPVEAVSPDTRIELDDSSRDQIDSNQDQVKSIHTVRPVTPELQPNTATLPRALSYEPQIMLEGGSFSTGQVPTPQLPALMPPGPAVVSPSVAGNEYFMTAAFQDVLSELGASGQVPYQPTVLPEELNEEVNVNSPVVAEEENTNSEYLLVAQSDTQGSASLKLDTGSASELPQMLGSDTEYAIPYRQGSVNTDQPIQPFSGGDKVAELPQLSRLNSALDVDLDDERFNNQFGYPPRGFVENEVDLDALQLQIDINNTTPVPIIVHEDVVEDEDMYGPHLIPPPGQSDHLAGQQRNEGLWLNGSTSTQSTEVLDQETIEQATQTIRATNERPSIYYHPDLSTFTEAYTHNNYMDSIPTTDLQESSEHRTLLHAEQPEGMLDIRKELDRDRSLQRRDEGDGRTLSIDGSIETVVPRTEQLRSTHDQDQDFAPLNRFMSQIEQLAASMIYPEDGTEGLQTDKSGPPAMEVDQLGQPGTRDIAPFHIEVSGSNTGESRSQPEPLNEGNTMQPQVNETRLQSAPANENVAIQQSPGLAPVVSSLLRNEKQREVAPSSGIPRQDSPDLIQAGTNTQPDLPEIVDVTPVHRASSRLRKTPTAFEDVYSEYFIPRNSLSKPIDLTSPTEKESHSQQNLGDHSYSDKALKQTVSVQHIARGRSVDAVITFDSDESLSQGLTTDLGYYVHLSALDKYYDQLVDVLAVCVADSAPAERAKSGPKDFHATIYLADTSLSDQDNTTISAQIFRPRKNVIPMVKRGDIVLLRNFKVQSQARKPLLLSNDESAWAIFRTLREAFDVETSGPPVEYGQTEHKYATLLKRWWIEEAEDRYPTIQSKASQPGTQSTSGVSRMPKSEPLPLEIRRSPRRTRHDRSQDLSSGDQSKSPSFEPVSPDFSRGAASSPFFPSSASLASPTSPASVETGQSLKSTSVSAANKGKARADPEVSRDASREVSSGPHLYDPTDPSIAQHSAPLPPKKHVHYSENESLHSAMLDTASQVSSADSAPEQTAFNTSIGSNGTPASVTSSARRHRHEVRSTSLVHELRDGKEYIDIEESEIVSITESSVDEDDDGQSNEGQTTLDSAVDTNTRRNREDSNSLAPRGSHSDSTDEDSDGEEFVQDDRLDPVQREIQVRTARPANIVADIAATANTPEHQHESEDNDDEEIPTRDPSVEIPDPESMATPSLAPNDDTDVVAVTPSPSKRTRAGPRKSAYAMIHAQAKTQPKTQKSRGHTRTASQELGQSGGMLTRSKGKVLEDNEHQLRDGVTYKD